MLADEKIIIKAINVETNEKYDINPAKKGRGVRVKPNLHNELPPGKYTLGVNSDEYKNSNKFDIRIGKSGAIIGERPWLQITKNSIHIVEQSEFDYEHMLRHHLNSITTILGDEIEILEAEITDYHGTARKDPLFVIDTTEI